MRFPPIDPLNPQSEVLKSLRGFTMSNFRLDADAADHFGVSHPYFSQILHGKKPVPEKIAASLGYRQVWVKGVS